jgi:hypothetical protein
MPDKMPPELGLDPARVVRQVNPVVRLSLKHNQSLSLSQSLSQSLSLSQNLNLNLNRGLNPVGREGELRLL